MNTTLTIGQVPWTRKELIESLDEFSCLYKDRPIKDNTGGMLAPHMFASWFAIRRLKPKAIVESGVWLGQGTWFFEKACPDAEIHCIDPRLDRIRYRSRRATYYARDFSMISWDELPQGRSLLFFDDHQNAYERLKTAKWFGFKHIIFEDNYPPCHGDFYSLKHVFSFSGFKYTPRRSPFILAYLKSRIRVALGIIGPDSKEIPPNEVDARYVQNNLETYYEFPPVFQTERTRWGDAWDDGRYPTPEPLLRTVEKHSQQIFLDEAMAYTWMCYVQLK